MKTKLPKGLKESDRNCKYKESYLTPSQEAFYKKINLHCTQFLRLIHDEVTGQWFIVVLAISKKRAYAIDLETRKLFSISTTNEQLLYVKKTNFARMKPFLRTLSDGIKTAEQYRKHRAQRRIESTLLEE